MLRTVLDVCSRQIVGWSMSERQKSSLVYERYKLTLRQAPVLWGVSGTVERDDG